ncbi:hypothetical protein [Arthrobacter sp. NPDC057259]|uniref:hypothetical protein n=1 Tax=Arthrobacter sp. NPDC057259 TaxID=3346073 RepID=UPI00362A6418
MTEQMTHFVKHMRVIPGQKGISRAKIQAFISGPYPCHEKHQSKGETQGMGRDVNPG